jgi:hypothetical protein
MEISTTDKIGFQEKIRNAILGEDVWENITTIGWTISLLLMIFLLPTLMLYSIFIPLGFGFIYRELSITRKSFISRYATLNFAKIRIWEDSQYNYEGAFAFKNSDVFPVILRNDVKAKIFYKAKKDRNELIKYLENLSQTKDKIKEELDELKKIEIEKKTNIQKNEIEEDEDDKFITEHSDDEDDEKGKKSLLVKNDEIASKIVELQDKLDELKKKELDEYEDKEIELNTRLFDLIEQHYNRNKIYYMKNVWSNVFKNEKDIIMLCPDDFWACLSFLPKDSRYKSFLITNGKRADFSVFDFGSFKGVRILKMLECNKTISDKDIESAKPELFRLDYLDAELVYIIKEAGKVLEDYEITVINNMELKGKIESLQDYHKLTMKQMMTENLEQTKLESRAKKTKLTFSNPPKNLYMITILGWVLALIILIFYLLKVNEYYG